MAELRPRSPFIECFATHAPVTTNGVTALDRDGLGLATIQHRKGRRSTLEAKVQAEFGVALPSTPQRVGHGDIAFIGTGPNTWLAVSEHDNNNFAIALQRNLEGLASVNDQSDGYAILRLTGPKVRDTLAKGVSIDLHDKVFCPGMVASTVAAHVGIIFWRLEDDAKGLAVFEIAVFRSLASDLWHFLSQSAAEFGLEIKT
jgi:sarcosine oxidase subunit gamma